MQTTKQNPPKPVFDPQLIEARQRRAKRYKTDRLIWTRTLADAQERLADINRDFPNVLVQGPEELVQAFEQSFTAPGRKIAAVPDTAKPYDLVVSLMHMHFENDINAVLGDLTSRLKPDGFFLCCFFGGQTLRRLRHVLYQAEEKLYGQVSPRIAPMIRLDQAVQLLGRCGLAMPVADRDVLNIHYKSLERLYEDLRAMGQTNALATRSPRPVSRRFFELVEKLYRQRHMDEQGRLPVCFETLWLSGWAPHPDQPKALKPGTAKTRLADALGVKEMKP